MVLKKIWGQSIYRNSVYLVLSTGILALSGFVYWFLAARLTSSAKIGLATSLVSVMTYIGIIAQMGFNVSLIRFLPHSRQPERTMNTAFTSVMGAALIASIIFLFLSGWITDSLGFLRSDLRLAVSFIFFMVFSALNIIIDSIFIALRQSKNVLIKTSLFSLLKIGLIFPLIHLGGYGLFSAWAAAIAISVGISFFFLPDGLRQNLRLRINRSVLKEVAAYSGGNYVASLAGNISTNAVPLILLANASAQNTAYFSIAMSFAALLFTIPVSVCNSLLAEGAAAEGQTRTVTMKAVKLISVLLIPSLLALLILGKFVLLIFGDEYVVHATLLLSLLAISSIFISVNIVCWTLLNLERRVGEILGVLCFNAFIILILTFLASKFGLNTVGLAWIIGQGSTSLAYLVVLSLRPLSIKVGYRGNEL